LGEWNIAVRPHLVNSQLDFIIIVYFKRIFSAFGDFSGLQDGGSFLFTTNPRIDSQGHILYNNFFLTIRLGLSRLKVKRESPNDKLCDQ
jgi:hypothetical protein